MQLPKVYARDGFDAGSVEDAVRDRYTRVAERGAAASDCCVEEVGSACCGADGSTMATVADALYGSKDLDVLTPEAMAASAGCGIRSDRRMPSRAKRCSIWEAVAASTASWQPSE